MQREVEMRCGGRVDTEEAGSGADDGEGTPSMRSRRPAADPPPPKWRWLNPGSRRRPGSADTIVTRVEHATCRRKHRDAAEEVT